MYVSRICFGVYKYAYYFCIVFATNVFCDIYIRKSHIWKLCFIFVPLFSFVWDRM